MREILYRGKPLDTGVDFDWVYWNEFGYVVDIDYGVDSEVSFELDLDCPIHVNEWCDIDQKTIGQFTGLCDKNSFNHETNTNPILTLVKFIHSRQRALSAQLYHLERPSSLNTATNCPALRGKIYYSNF